MLVYKLANNVAIYILLYFLILSLFLQSAQPLSGFNGRCVEVTKKKNFNSRKKILACYKRD
jgi:hypothetical protein